MKWFFCDFAAVENHVARAVPANADCVDFATRYFRLYSLFVKCIVHNKNGQVAGFTRK